MLLRHVLLLVTFITLVGATFSLPKGLAETSTLEPTANGGTKRLKVGDVLTQRSPSNPSAPTIQSDLTEIISSSTASDHSSAPITSAKTGSEEFNPDPLTLGSKGDSVRELQAVLKRLGYYYGSVNGVLGKDTQTAVNRFQKEAGLPETNKVDAATLENLKQAERSLASQKRILRTPLEGEGVSLRDPQAGATDGFPGDSTSLTPPPSTQSQGVGEIGWMGWVMGSVTGLAIAGSLVYGLYRSGNRMATEDADFSLLGMNSSKVSEEGLEDRADTQSSETQLTTAAASNAETDFSSPPPGSLNAPDSLNGRRENGAGDSHRDGSADAPAPALLTPNSDMPSFLGIQPESRQSELLALESVPSGSVQSERVSKVTQSSSLSGVGQTEPVRFGLPPSDRSQQSIEPTSQVVIPSATLDALALQSAEPNALSETTRIPKLSLVDRLINDLHHADPVKRRGAIWELGQEGDSRAVQPLVDLMLEADSQQRTLILAAIAEISIRTLKPMKRALLTSLQDENSDVRKNAIRDTTRVYDMMAQLSQLLSHTVNDPDPEVQETAQWALAQLSRHRPNLGDSGSTSSEHSRPEER